MPYGVGGFRLPLVNAVIALMAFALLVLTAGEASAETRKLKLYFLHTGERAEITFKKNGKYIDSGLKKINRFLRDWRRNEPTKMDPRLLDLIWEVYKESGSKKYIHVISGYRSPATNSLLRKRGRGVAKKSQHTLGKALDFFIPGVGLRKLRYIGLRKGIGGVGYYPKSGSPFVHMDTGRVRHWPRMTRKELVKVFPKGKTLHVPSDGKPLARYNLAKAEYERRSRGQGKIVVAKAEEIEKKPSLFAKLLGRDDEEEDNVGSATAPKAVKTTSEPGPISSEVVKPSTPAAPVPATPVVESPESIIAALPSNAVPIPVIAPRIPAREGPLEREVPRPEIAIAENTTEPETTDPVSSEIELAYAVPVPAPRPQFSIAEATPEGNVVETGLATGVDGGNNEGGQSIQVAALSPREIEDLRRQVYSVLAQDESGAVEPNSRISVAAATTDASLGTSLALVPQPNPRKTSAAVIDQQLASLQPIEPGAESSDRIAVPEVSPVERPVEQQVATLKPNEAETTNPAVPAEPIEPGTASTGEPALPSPSPVERTPVETASLGTPAPGIPVPQPAQRTLVLAANSQSGPEEQSGEIKVRQPAARAASTNKLETLHASNGQHTLGKWALATNASIERIADIRPPAYARNIIRERPSSVLARGFVPGSSSQQTARFSGSSIEFLDFKRFQ